MISNLPPEFRDLEIHIQDLLTQVKDSVAEITSLKKEVATLKSATSFGLLDLFPLGPEVVSQYTTAVTQTIPDNATFIPNLEQDTIESAYLVRQSASSWEVQENGLFYIQFQALFNFITEDYQHIESRIILNGTTIQSSRDIDDDVDNGGRYSNCNVAVPLKLKKGDIIRVSVFQNNTANITRTLNNSNSFTNLRTIYLGKGE